MVYAVKEIFKTLQGEGAMSGRTAVFCRFAGCNLWSGREKDRAQAQCTFCDTDFIGTDGENGGKFKTAEALAAEITRIWNGDPTHRFVVFTGGEPLLQLDSALVDAVHAQGFTIAVETNGTLPAPDGIDWLCVSPKSNNPLAIHAGDELKLVYPQPDCMPETVANLDFKQFWLQPMDGPDQARNTAQAVAFCLQNPQWRLSLQTHKFIGIP